MTRILTTTAVLLALSGGAYAQSTTETPADPAAESTMPATDPSVPTAETAPMTESGVDTTATAPDTAMSQEMGIGAAAGMDTDFYASDLIGMRVYNVAVDYDTASPIAAGAETEWEDIGEINDIVVTADGKVSAVILGVGGFLGLGERDVAVNMGAISVVVEEGDSNDRFLVVQTSKEELEQLTEFTREDL